MDILTFVQEDKPDAPKNYGCGKCKLFWGGSLENAEQCCQPPLPKNCACGKLIDASCYVVCGECRAKNNSEREAARFEKAKKVTYEEYDEEIIYVDGYGSGDMIGDGYWSSLDEFLDHCESEDIEPPEYVWGVSQQKFTLDAEDIIDSALENQEFYEDARGNISKEDMNALDKFLTEWCKKVDLTCYMEDNSVAVLVPAKEASDE